MYTCKGGVRIGYDGREIGQLCCMEDEEEGREDTQDERERSIHQ